MENRGAVTAYFCKRSILHGAKHSINSFGRGLARRFRDTAAMNLHLAEIFDMVSPAKHAVLLSITPAGTSLAASPCSTTSPCCHCRRNARSWTVLSDLSPENSSNFR